MGFFRKVAGAFVELPPPDPPPPPPVASVVPRWVPTAEDDERALTVSADELFARAGIPDGPGSALRVARLVDGLAKFPAEQRLDMVRALDAADDSWDEAGVLADAAARQAALQAHLESVDRDHARQVGETAERIRRARASGAEVVAELDRQLAELQALRTEAVTRTDEAVAELDHERESADAARERARAEAAALSVRLAELVAFFGGSADAR